MTTTNLFVISNCKTIANLSSFGILLPFFETSWGVGVLNSATFNSFHSRVDFGTILEVLRNFKGGGGGLNPPTLSHPPSVRHCLSAVGLSVEIRLGSSTGISVTVRHVSSEFMCLLMLAFYRKIFT